MQRVSLYHPFHHIFWHIACGIGLVAACTTPAFSQVNALHYLPAITESFAPQQSGLSLAPLTGKKVTPIPSGPAMRGAITENATLLKVVALTRHGVRSPVQSSQELAQWSKKDWPVWPVTPGNLTPRGAELISYLWSDLRDQLSAEGLAAAPDSGCPPIGSVFVHADNDERTRATASALLTGFAPGCGLSYTYLDAEGHLVLAPNMSGENTAVSLASPISSPVPSKKPSVMTALFGHLQPDPLFHPVHAGVCTPSASDALKTAAQINIKEMEHALRQPLILMSKLVGRANDNLCNSYRARPGCVAPLLPTRLLIRADGEAHLDGGLGIASSMAEIWLLEAAQWPTANPAWNGLDTASLQHILPIHTIPFNAVQRSTTIAKTQGSALLAAMVSALMGTPYSTKPADSASLIVFVGHDTSIAHVASLLGLNWKTQSWPENAVPPGATLLLSLWESNGQKLVTASFVTQGLNILRADDPQILSQASPEWASLTWPPSFSPSQPTPNGLALPLSSLASKLPTIINPLCLPASGL